MKIIELKEQITELRNRCQEIVDLAKKEVRDLSEEEEKEIEDAKEQIDEKKEEIKAAQDEIDKKVPAADDEETSEEKTDDDNENRNKKIIRSKTNMKKQSLVKEIRNALAENRKSIHVNAETRSLPTVTVQGENGVHDQVVETEIEGILEPLYANSILTQLGARWYSGLPMGDVQIPVMTKSTVNWEGETSEASATGNTFNAVKLTPKRLSAYIDISKQLLAQDTIGVEAAIRRDIVKALNDKLEATLLSAAEGTGDKPAGLFYNKTLAHVTDFAKLCDFEAEVEEDNVYGNMKYVLSPKAKSAFRCMIKGNNATGMVYENGEMDGIQTLVTSNVAAKNFIYGNFENLVVGSWGDIELVLDPYTQATKSCVRIVINAFFDFKPVRNEAFAFGTVDDK